MLGLCLFVSQKCYAATIEINDCLGMGGNGNSPVGIPWEWELVTKLGMGMGGNGNIKSHSRSSLKQTNKVYCVMDIYKFVHWRIISSQSVFMISALLSLEYTWKT